MVGVRATAGYGLHAARGASRHVAPARVRVAWLCETVGTWLQGGYHHSFAFIGSWVRFIGNRNGHGFHSEMCHMGMANSPG